MGVFRAVWLFVRVFLAGRAVLLAENLALRQQLSVVQRTVLRPKLRVRDRVLWVRFKSSLMPFSWPVLTYWIRAITCILRRFTGHTRDDPPSRRCR